MIEPALLERLRESTPRLEPGDAGRGSEPGLRFGEIVAELVSDVNQKQNEAAEKAEGVARGDVGIMDAVLAMNDADLSLRWMMQMRDRAIESYQRLLRTI